MSAVRNAAMPCDQCDGDGTILTPYQRPTRNRFMSDHGLELDECPEPCPACGGLGIRLPQTPAEAFGGDHSAPQ